MSKSKPRRPVWFHLHFWIGWIAAIPIIVVCLTGGVLAFEKYLRHAEFPEQYKLTPTGEPMDIDEVMAIIESAEPKLILRHLGLPEDPRHAYSAYVGIVHDDGSKGGGSIIVNPYTGELLHKGDKFTLSALMTDLHRHLATGVFGQQIIGISSVVLALTCIFGLILWWPMRGRTFVRAWKRGRALDWHNVLGLVAMAPLIIMAITGICFTWGDKIFPVLDKLQTAPSKPKDPVVEVPEGGEKLPLSVPLANIWEAFPEGQVTGVQPTGAPTRPYAFFVTDQGTHYRVWMNPYTGEEISRLDGKLPGPVGWYRQNFARLHTMGYHPILSSLWGLLSAVGGVIAITGVWISVKRWRRKGKAARA